MNQLSPTTNRLAKEVNGFEIVLNRFINEVNRFVFAADFWHPCGKIFSAETHVQGKDHACTSESLNNRIRCHRARLKRKTRNYSKPQTNLAASLWFFMVRKCGGELVPELKPIPV